MGELVSELGEQVRPNPEPAQPKTCADADQLGRYSTSFPGVV